MLISLISQVSLAQGVSYNGFTFSPLPVEKTSDIFPDAVSLNNQGNQQPRNRVVLSGTIIIPDGKTIIIDQSIDLVIKDADVQIGKGAHIIIGYPYFSNGSPINYYNFPRGNMLIKNSHLYSNSVDAMWRGFSMDYDDNNKLNTLSPFFIQVDNSIIEDARMAFDLHAWSYLECKESIFNRNLFSISFLIVDPVYQPGASSNWFPFNRLKINHDDQPYSSVVNQYLGPVEHGGVTYRPIRSAHKCIFTSVSSPLDYHNDTNWKNLADTMPALPIVKLKNTQYGNFPNTAIIIDGVGFNFWYRTGGSFEPFGVDQVGGARSSLNIFEHHNMGYNVLGGDVTARNTLFRNIKRHNSHQITDLFDIKYYDGTKPIGAYSYSDLTGAVVKDSKPCFGVCHAGTQYSHSFFVNMRGGPNNGMENGSNSLLHTTIHSSTHGLYTLRPNSSSTPYGMHIRSTLTDYKRCDIAISIKEFVGNSNNKISEVDIYENFFDHNDAGVYYSIVGDNTDFKVRDNIFDCPDPYGKWAFVPPPHNPTSPTWVQTIEDPYAIKIKNNGSQVKTTDINIYDNTIQNGAYGIVTEEYDEPLQIYNNAFEYQAYNGVITFDTTKMKPAGEYWERGAAISMRNTLKASVTNNTIEGPSGYYYPVTPSTTQLQPEYERFVGIQADASPIQRLKCNWVTGTFKPFRYIRNCEGMRMYNNTSYDQNVYGLTVEKSQGAQGRTGYVARSSNQGHANRFLDNYDNPGGYLATTFDSDGQFSIFNTMGGVYPQPQELNFIGIPLPIIQSMGTAHYAILDCQSEEEEDIDPVGPDLYAVLRQLEYTLNGDYIALYDSASADMYSYYDHKRLYRQLHQEPQLQTATSSLQNYYQYSQSQPYAQIVNIESLLHPGYFLDSTAQLDTLLWQQTWAAVQSISPSTDIEEYEKQYLEVLVQAYAQDKLADIDPYYLQQLHTLALGCERAYGEVALKARGLMEILYPGYLQEDPDNCNPPIQIAQSNTKEDEALRVYPNPTEDWVTVELEASESDEVLTLYDVQGREVMQIEVSAHQPYKSISLKELNSGLYLLKTTSGESIKILKK